MLDRFIRAVRVDSAAPPRPGSMAPLHEWLAHCMHYEAIDADGRDGRVTVFVAGSSQPLEAAVISLMLPVSLEIDAAKALRDRLTVAIAKAEATTPGAARAA